MDHWRCKHTEEMGLFISPHISRQQYEVCCTLHSPQEQHRCSAASTALVSDSAFVWNGWTYFPSYLDWRKWCFSSLLDQGSHYSITSLGLACGGLCSNIGLHDSNISKGTQECFLTLFTPLPCSKLVTAVHETHSLLHVLPWCCWVYLGWHLHTNNSSMLTHSCSRSCWPKAQKSTSVKRKTEANHKGFWSKTA